MFTGSVDENELSVIRVGGVNLYMSSVNKLMTDNTLESGMQYVKDVHSSPRWFLM